MCYHYQDRNRNWLRKIKPGEAIAESIQRDSYESLKVGFAHPEVSIITNSQSTPIQTAVWGLLPFWAKDRSFQKNTLNARVETLAEKPSFKASVKNRCLIPANSFIEWQWLDPKGKQKQKYEVSVAGAEGFCFAGLWSHWTDRATGEIVPTWTMITREAEGIMREIHNSKLRMPMIVKPEQWDAWLNCEIDVVDPPELEAEKV